MVAPLLHDANFLLYKSWALLKPPVILIIYDFYCIYPHCSLPYSIFHFIFFLFRVSKTYTHSKLNSDVGSFIAVCSIWASCEGSLHVRQFWCSGWLPNTDCICSENHNENKICGFLCYPRQYMYLILMHFTFIAK